MRALLCSGGNAKIPLAMYTLRQLRALHGTEYRLVAGVSCGSIEGAKFAEDLGESGALDELEKLIRQVDGVDFYMKPNLRTDIGHRKNLEKRHRAGLMTLAPLHERMMDSLHPERIPEGVRCEVGMVDLRTKEYLSIAQRETLDKRAWATAICASCAEAPVMDWWPVTTRDNPQPRACIDGGFRHVVPDIGERWRQFSAIDVILHSTVDRSHNLDLEDVDDMLEVAGRAAEIWTDGIILRDLERLKMYAAHGVHVTLYAPPESPRDPFDASKETMAWRLEELGPKVWNNGQPL